METTALPLSASTVMIATDLPALSRLAASLDATFVALPPAAFATPIDNDWSFGSALETWRADAGLAAPSTRVVVAAWTPQHAAGRLIDIDAATFAARAELPFVAWFVALGNAVRRCADDGAIVAIIERPSPLDCAGWAPEGGVADAVEAFVRSLSRAEGHRGVRVNAVTTPHRLIPDALVAPSPPLANYPGTLELEVASAVSALLGPAVGGVTGTVVHVDCGRSWR